MVPTEESRDTAECASGGRGTSERERNLNKKANRRGVRGERKMHADERKGKLEKEPKGRTSGRGKPAGGQ